MAKYEMIANDIIQRIHNHEFDEDNKLPTEDMLIRYYNVSRNTIRSSLKQLSRQGILYSRRGSGFYVRKRKKDDCVPITSTMGLSYDFSQRSLINKVLSITILEADDELASEMLCEVGTSIYYVKRLRILDGEKYALEFSYYNKDIVRYLNKEICEKSVYSYLQNDVGLHFGYADKYISAIKLDASYAQFLDLKEGDPALVVADNVYLDNGLLFNVSKVMYNYKYANFYASSVR